MSDQNAKRFFTLTRCVIRIFLRSKMNDQRSLHQSNIYEIMKLEDMIIVHLNETSSLLFPH